MREADHLCCWAIYSHDSIVGNEPRNELSCVYLNAGSLPTIHLDFDFILG